VLALVGEGLSNEAIAERLFMSPATVKMYGTRIMSKLAAHDLAELVVVADETMLVRPGWLSPPTHLACTPPRSQPAPAAVATNTPGRTTAAGGAP
jgi:hypothetical protein